MNRRQFVHTGVGALCAAAESGVPLFAAGLPPAADPQPVHLTQPELRTLPLGQILPAGWLRQQLRIQADGLSGHLDEFWPDVGPHSGWLGGTGEDWERGPYFVDGLFPLAVLLGDASLKAKAMRFIDWTLEHQAPTGMIGPAGNDDWWPRMVMVKVLMQYQEATNDPRVVPVLTRYFRHQLEHMPSRPLTEWGKYRWQDEAFVVLWLYGKTGDAFLLDLVSLLRQQGYDWVAAFRNFTHTGVTPRSVVGEASDRGDKRERMETHGVNNGQALKTAAVQYLLSGNRREEFANFQRQVSTLDRYHGMPNGMFTCDEHLAGLEANHGTELCTVVETLFSLEVALAAFGEPSIADRIETIAFNALPGTFDDSMWAHQYDQQANQIQASLNSKPWTTNGPESNLYGLEPNFGCCTANFHQGWPKLAASLWMRSADGGLAACIYAPCQIQTTVQTGKVRLTVATEYPFRQSIRITVDPDRAGRFPIHLRVPAWAGGAAIHVNGEAVSDPVRAGTFVPVLRHWTAGDVIEMQLPMVPRVSRWHNDAIALMRGPLLFSYSPGQSWVKLRDRGPAADWQVFPTRPWNYALQVDESSAAQILVTEHAIGPRPFAAEGTPVRMEVRGRQLDTWRSEDGVAAAVPKIPQVSGRPEERLELIPYAAAKLRVTVFPQLVQNTEPSTSKVPKGI